MILKFCRIAPQDHFVFWSRGAIQVEYANNIAAPIYVYMHMQSMWNVWCDRVSNNFESKK